MKSHGITLGLVFLAFSLIAPAAMAGEPNIKDTGIPEFDEVFAKARDLQGAINTQKSDLASQRATLNKALGVAEDAPIETAMADLKTKVQGKVQLVMDGRIPRLKPDDTMPENLKVGVEATNKLSESSVQVSDNCKTDLVPRSEDLASKTAEFPAKVPTLVKNPLEVGKKSGTVKKNAKIVSELPDRAKGLQAESEQTVNAVTAAFSAP